MKTLSLFSLILVAGLLGSCGNRDTNNDQDADTMMTDSAVMDNTRSSGTPSDTTVIGRDTSVTDTSTVRP